MLATRNTQQMLNIYQRTGHGRQLTNCHVDLFLPNVIMLGLANLLPSDSVLCWKNGGATHSTISKKLCAENVVHMLRATGQNALVSRRCPWPLASGVGLGLEASPLPNPPLTFLSPRWSEAWGPRRWPWNGQHGVYLWQLPGFDHRPEDELQRVLWLRSLLWMLCSKEILLWVCLRSPLALVPFLRVFLCFFFFFGNKKPFIIKRISNIPTSKETSTMNPHDTHYPDSRLGRFCYVLSLFLPFPPTLCSSILKPITDLKSFLSYILTISL